ncbi:hypothetical protein Tco_1041715 [Tanacetum coccineum]|uniref:Uncharacterized protein n=1 Tax=Tanacetum coccineum TaxID=301880 RepID=A0ABQ5GGX6_9ASTR
MVKPVWNNAQRVNHQNFAKKTHPFAKKNMVPKAVLMKSGLISINTARQVNTAHSKTIVNAARPMSYLSKIAHSTVKRTIHKNTTFKTSNFNQRVNTVRGKNVNTARPKAVVNAIKGNNVNAGNPQIDLHDQGVIDSGCSRHMTENMSYLTDYEDIFEYRCTLILWQGELYQKTDHVFTFIEVIRMVRLGMIKRSKCENKGIVPTEMELVLEYTQQGASHEVSEHLKMEMEIPCVKASANSVIIFFFTSAQDGNRLLDDERLCLDDDLKKAHDQNQNKSK